MVQNMFMKVCTGALSQELYVSYHQHESAGNGHKSAHGFILGFYRQPTLLLD